MKLITAKTTIQEFNNSRDWLLKDPPTGTMYQVRRSTLNDGDYYLYVKQSGRDNMPVYVRNSFGQGVVIATKQCLLDVVKTGKIIVR